MINLSADKPRVLAETFRVLRPGGRLGVSDVIADDGLDPAQRAEAEQRTGCTTGTLTAGEYAACCWPAGSPASNHRHPGRRAGPALSHHPGHPARRAARHPDPAHAGDANQVLAIYQAGLDTGDASFETTPPPEDPSTRGNCPRGLDYVSEPAHYSLSHATTRNYRSSAN